MQNQLQSHVHGFHVMLINISLGMTIWLTVSTTTSCTNLYMARFRKRLEESRSRKSGRKKSTTGTCGTGLPRNVHSKRRLFGVKYH